MNKPQKTSHIRLHQIKRTTHAPKSQTTSTKPEHFPEPNGIKRAKDQTLTQAPATNHEKGEKEKLPKLQILRNYDTKHEESPKTTVAAEIIKP